MIEEVEGDLLRADADALVNTVNTVGVMGKGIALQFKKKYPENYKSYERACRDREVQIGKMFVFDLAAMHGARYIINFPTKEHWRARSRISDIETGLKDLSGVVRALNIESIAIPPLGCGNGGLDWRKVRPLIYSAFESLPDVHVLLFAPFGAAAADAMTIRTKRPRMTASGAAVLALMRNYATTGYQLTLLEVQKLVYFLKLSGQPMHKVSFVKERYGPYADALRHMLDRMDGHFISGYGDGSNRPDTPIRLVPDALQEADEFLKAHDATHSQFQRVAELIEGFETPYGMELLSTVHWVATHDDPEAKADSDRAMRAVHNWSDRKRTLFKPEHIQIAWERLRALRWFDASTGE